MNYHCECIKNYCEKESSYKVNQSLLDNYALASRCSHNDLFKKEHESSFICDCNDLEYLHNRYLTYVMEYDEKSANIIKRLLKHSKENCFIHKDS
jgi:hypothetical protein